MYHTVVECATLARSSCQDVTRESSVKYQRNSPPQFLKLGALRETLDPISFTRHGDHFVGLNVCSFSVHVFKGSHMYS